MLDGETNTLTIDNLIVRKLMQVYELVVNKISATNGSLWVSDSAKILKSTLIVPDAYFIKKGNTYEKYTQYIDDSGNSTYYTNPLNFHTSATYWTAFYNSELGDLLDGYKGISDSGSLLYYTTNVAGANFEIEASFEQYNESTDSNDRINTFYKYFNGNFYYIELDEDYCPFRVNDLIRCQKFTGKDIKYYDAIVTRIVDTSHIIIRLSNIETDLYSEYDIESGVTNYYNTQYERNENGDYIYYKDEACTQKYNE